MASSQRYLEAGVDQNAADALAKVLAERISHKTGTIFGMGSFAATLEVPKDIKSPAVVSACDGVGSKTRLLKQAGRLSTAGLDVVAACVNDIACLGARPWYFLDYYGCAKLEASDATEIFNGMQKACEQAGCEIVGGETAQLPGMLAEGDIDLVGFATGILDKDSILGPHRVDVGDALVGIIAKGLHCNGFTLVRKALAESNTSVVDNDDLADKLLAPTPLYSPAVTVLLERHLGLHSVAHITGGGLAANVGRSLPDGLGVVIDRSSWRWSAAHEWLAKAAKVDQEEMLVSTNGGLGMVLVIAKENVAKAQRVLEDMGHSSSLLGQVVEGQGVNVV